MTSANTVEIFFPPGALQVEKKPNNKTQKNYTEEQKFSSSELSAGDKEVHSLHWFFYFSRACSQNKDTYLIKQMFCVYIY